MFSRIKISRAILILAISLSSGFSISDSDPRNRMAFLTHGTQSFKKGEQVDDCTIREFGYGVIENPIIIEGSYGDGFSANYCSVSIEKNIFESTFEYCHLSGITLSKKQTPNLQSCNFRYIARNGAYIFTSDREIQCEYICVKK